MRFLWKNYGSSIWNINMPFLLLYMALFTWPGSLGWRKILPDITGSYIWRRMIIFLFVKCSSSLTFCGLPMYRLWSFISFSRTILFLTISLIVLPLLFKELGIWISVPVAESIGVVVSIICFVKYKRKYLFYSED